jgi:ferredoxin
MADTSKLSIRIVQELCQGHNRCCLIAPELFESDELGNARVKGDGIVTEELLSKVELAVANCPENAIRLSRQ